MEENRQMAESMKGLKRTCRCAELSEANIGQEVTVMGWIQKTRNTGGLIFADLRDRSGLLQINFQEEKLATSATCNQLSPNHQLYTRHISL